MLIQEILWLRTNFCKLPFLLNLLVFNGNDLQARLILEKVIGMYLRYQLLKRLIWKTKQATFPSQLENVPREVSFNESCWLYQ